MKNTPTPWKLRNDDREYMGKIIESDCMGEGHYASIAQTIQRNAHPVYGGEVTQEEAESNAELIVLAVNSWFDIDALEKRIQQLK